MLMFYRGDLDCLLLLVRVRDGNVLLAKKWNEET